MANIKTTETLLANIVGKLSDCWLLTTDLGWAVDAVAVVVSRQRQTRANQLIRVGQQNRVGAGRPLERELVVGEWPLDWLEGHWFESGAEPIDGLGLCLLINRCLPVIDRCARSWQTWLADLPGLSHVPIGRLSGPTMHWSSGSVGAAPAVFRTTPDNSRQLQTKPAISYRFASSRFICVDRTQTSRVAEWVVGRRLVTGHCIHWRRLWLVLSQRSA